MKILILILLSLGTFNVLAKTCTATLNGRLKYSEFYFHETKVFYPDDPAYSRPAKWEGMVTTKKFIPPAPIEIECGKPYLDVNFGSFNATGMLPPMIETYPWTVIDWSGKPRNVPAEKIYGFGDSSDYPYPATFFEGKSDILIMEPVPGGKDICDVTKLDVNVPSLHAVIKPDPLTTSYSQPSEWGTGSYKWDPWSSPYNEDVELEVVDASVTIVCEAKWKYEANFYWPYIIPADHDSMCGPGEVHREMKLEGEFTLSEDNHVVGNINVNKPTVTYSGNVKGEYSGLGFTIPLTGEYKEDMSGNMSVLLPVLEGGDGISWSYTLMCPYGNITNNLFGAASHYLKIMMEQEDLGEEGGYFRLNADGDEKTMNVDMGGQGQVTVKRSWKKIK